jgi:NAD(P)-dependent dehydrogenase (short-subunit alcohol dehydrogenase family)
MNTMKTILITGANRGLGYEMVRQFSNRDEHQIIACCRSPASSDALNHLATQNQQIEVHTLNVADMSSIEALGEELTTRPIDILINNAGIFGKNDPATTGFADQAFGKSDFEVDWINPFRVNVIGQMMMVETLISNIEASSIRKIAMITSIVASIKLAQGHMFGYAASKSAANMTAKNLSVALKNRGIIVNPIHPGYAKTDMSGEQAHVEVEDAVAGVLQQIDSMSLENSGAFLSFDGSILPW